MRKVIFVCAVIFGSVAAAGYLVGVGVAKTLSLLDKVEYGALTAD